MWVIWTVHWMVSHRSLGLCLAIAFVYCVLTNHTGLALPQTERKLGLGGLLH